jgi:hypothetical protein
MAILSTVLAPVERVTFSQDVVLLNASLTPSKTKNTSFRRQQSRHAMFSSVPASVSSRNDSPAPQTRRVKGKVRVTCPHAYAFPRRTNKQPPSPISCYRYLVCARAVDAGVEVAREGNAWCSSSAKCRADNACGGNSLTAKVWRNLVPLRRATRRTMVPPGSADAGTRRLQRGSQRALAADNSAINNVCTRNSNPRGKCSSG